MNLPIKKIKEISVVFSSFKRLVMLYIIEIEPCGYTQLTKRVESLDIPIGSSEVYKHLRILLKNDLISKKQTSYLITTKGMKIIELINNIPEESENIEIGYINKNELVDTFVKGQGGGK